MSSSDQDLQFPNDKSVKDKVYESAGSSVKSTSSNNFEKVV